MQKCCSKLFASIHLTVQLFSADAKTRSRRLRLAVGGGVGGQQVQSPDRVNVEVLLQLQRSNQDADGVARLLFQLPTNAGGSSVMLGNACCSGKRNRLGFRFPLTTPRMFSVISFSCCNTLNLRWAQITLSDSHVN